MSTSGQLQSETVKTLKTSNKLTVPVPIVRRRPGEVKSDLEAAANMMGICIHVLPPMPEHKIPETEGLIVFDRASVIVRIYEIIEMNRSGVSGYDLIEQVATALHWTNPGNLLDYPLELDDRPVKQADIPAYEIDGKQYPQSRIFDVVFNAVYQIK